MSAAPAYAPPRSSSADDEQRRRAISHALYQGALIPTTLWTERGFVVIIPHGLIRALVRARDLTATHYRYLLSLLEFSCPQDTEHPYAAIRSAKRTRLPSIRDWSAWLGDMKPQQIYTTRRQLAARNIIAFVDDDPDKVAFNAVWETWHPSVFQPRPARAGAGRPRATTQHTDPEGPTPPATPNARRAPACGSRQNQTSMPTPAVTTRATPAPENGSLAACPAMLPQPDNGLAEHAPAVTNPAEPVMEGTDAPATPTVPVYAADQLSGNPAREGALDTDHDGVVPARAINRLADHKSIDLPAEIDRFAPVASEMAPQADAMSLPKKDRDLSNNLSKGVTPATAGVPQRRTPRPAIAHAQAEKLRADGLPSQEVHTSSKENEDRILNLFAHSARAPRVALPQRQAGETTRAYWLRALLAADPAQPHAQRSVVHAAARAVLGLTLDKGDLRLLGQLRRAAGSWGTVLHWVLKAGDVAAVDVRAYLYGFLRHQEQAASGRAEPSWLPVTPGNDTAAGETWEADAEPQDEAIADGPPVAEDEHQTRLRKLGNALRARGVWQVMGVPAGGYTAILERLDMLRGQGGWTLAEFVLLVALLANPAQMPGMLPAQRWEVMLSLLEQRAQARAQRQGEPLSLVSPAVVVPVGPTPTVGVLPAAPAIADPAEVSRRAKALRRLCGAGTEFGRTLLAYLEMDERDALEEIAATLLTAALPEEQTEAALRRAWQEIVHMGGSVTQCARHQRQHHWRMALRHGIGTSRGKTVNVREQT